MGARAIRDKKERAYKNRAVRKCTTTDKWANCTAHPISWYTNCKGAGTSRPTWRRCGFLNAGGQYLCRRVTCRNVRVRIKTHSAHKRKRQVAVLRPRMRGWLFGRLGL